MGEEEIIRRLGELEKKHLQLEEAHSAKDKTIQALEKRIEELELRLETKEDEEIELKIFNAYQKSDVPVAQNSLKSTAARMTIGLKVRPILVTFWQDILEYSISYAEKKRIKHPEQLLAPLGDVLQYAVHQIERRFSIALSKLEGRSVDENIIKELVYNAWDSSNFRQFQKPITDAGDLKEKLSKYLERLNKIGSDMVGWLGKKDLKASFADVGQGVILDRYKHKYFDPNVQELVETVEKYEKSGETEKGVILTLLFAYRLVLTIVTKALMDIPEFERELKLLKN